MNLLRTILKTIGALIVGMTVGLLIAAIGIVMFTDLTVTDFLNKLVSINFTEIVTSAIVGVAAFIFSIGILIPIHEAGHLVCGLLSGYKFVSFRIFNYTIIKIDGKLRIKKFAVAGTGGQCLLVPPDRSLEKIPTVLYNLGGILANIAIFLIILPLMWMNLNPFISEFALIFLLTDAIIILMNGIPMQLAGIGNDGHNLIEILRNHASKRALVVQLRSNAMIQNGIRPKDMPESWFFVPEKVNYKNALEVSIPIMAASRLIDEMRFTEALEAFEKLYMQRNEIMPLYVKEIACELAYLRLMTGQPREAETLLDDELRKYIESYRNVMSSKERLLFAIALYLDNDRDKAIEIFQKLNAHRSEYLLQGEVNSDIALIQYSLRM